METVVTLAVAQDLYPEQKGYKCYKTETNLVYVVQQMAQSQVELDFILPRRAEMIKNGLSEPRKPHFPGAPVVVNDLQFLQDLGLDYLDAPMTMVCGRVSEPVQTEDDPKVHVVVELEKPTTAEDMAIILPLDFQRSFDATYPSEEFLRRYGVEWTLLRPPQMFNPILDHDFGRKPLSGFYIFICHRTEDNQRLFKAMEDDYRRKLSQRVEVWENVLKLRMELMDQLKVMPVNGYPFYVYMGDEFFAVNVNGQPPHYFRWRADEVERAVELIRPFVITDDQASYDDVRAANTLLTAVWVAL